MKAKISDVKKSGVGFLASTGGLYGIHIDDVESKDDVVFIEESFESADDELSPEYFLSLELDGNTFKKGFFSESELKAAKQKIFHIIDKDMKVVSCDVQGAIGEIKSKWSDGSDVSLALFDEKGIIWNYRPHDDYFFDYDTLSSIRDAFTVMQATMNGYRYKLCIADKKTFEFSLTKQIHKKHPHACGEDLKF